MPWHKPRVREARVNPGDAVILLHGLWRSLWAMEPMAQFLNEQGYHTINVPYPSFRKPMEELTEIIHDALKLHGGDRKVHFVTHSLGGVLARQLLHQLPPDLAGRVVMLAPPHQGSEIVDYLSRYGPMRLSLGPAGMQLGSGKIDAPHYLKKSIPPSSWANRVFSHYSVDFSTTTTTDLSLSNAVKSTV